MGVQESSYGRYFAILIGAIVLVFASVSITLLLTQQTSSPRTLELPRQEKWGPVMRIEIPGKDVEVVRFELSGRCYIMPKSLLPRDTTKARPMIPVRDPLPESVVEEMAGPTALEMCENMPVYLAREAVPEHLEIPAARKRRQANEFVDSEGRTLGATNAKVTDYVEKEPRCMDIVLDCVTQIGEKQSCNTGVNGIFYMDRTCNSETEFEIFMTKPPGRLLKILQRQGKICRLRRLEGLRC